MSFEFLIIDQRNIRVLVVAGAGSIKLEKLLTLLDWIRDTNDFVDHEVYVTERIRLCFISYCLHIHIDSLE